MDRRIAALGTLSLLALSACGDPVGPVPVEEITELPRALTADEIQVIGASNRFAFDLLHLASKPDSNLFLSPVSASMALGMTMNGTAGETLAQMRTALGFGDLGLDEIDASYRSLIDLLLGLDPSVEMAIGNSVWSRTGFPVRQTFLDTVREYFDAEAEELDFSQASAPARINGWVSDATQGRIDEIVPAQIPAEVVMYLINAIYFKGSWTQQFDPKDTRDEPFHFADGSTRSTKMMRLEATLPYRAGADFQAVDLPYGGQAFSMTVVLPREGVPLEQVVASLDTEAWDDLVSGFFGVEGTLWLPRFRMSYERLLNDDLKALGMTDAFSETDADFTPMYRDALAAQLHVQKVKQKTFLKVDEVGTTAAAVTSVEIGVTSAPLTYVVEADRPFFLAIRERLSGTVLFAGFIVQAPTD